MVFSMIPFFLGPGDEVHEDLAVHGGLEDRPLGLQLLLELPGIDQVSVVGDGQEALGMLGQEGLGVFQQGRTGRGIPHVADRGSARQGLKLAGIERVRHQPHAPVALGFPAVAGDDSGALLPPVLEGVEAQIGQAGNVGVVKNPEDPALLFRMKRRKGAGHCFPGLQ